jgi:hypothetical protein
MEAPETDSTTVFTARITGRDMSDQAEIDSVSLTEKVVFLGVVQLSDEEETPVDSSELTAICNDHCSELELDLLGHLTEVDVMRALSSLSASGFLTEAEVEERSPVGKGRPVYELDVEHEPLVEELAEDERVGPLVDRVRAS